MAWTRFARLGSVLLLGLTLVPIGQRLADACGGFFSVRTVSPEQRPSLSREKVLLIHDAQKLQQHFVREVAFERASEPFGFVVPTPSRPEVAAVERTPFTKLRERFGFAHLPRIVSGYGQGPGSGGGVGGSGVEVLSVEQVGSFTAFVLAATDAEALASWLADNDLVSTPEADAWLAHYVRMGFYYVALRYDPPKSGAGSGAIAAETIRISFATPVPYYPYFEPETTAPNQRKRLMELWYVGNHEVVPVALREAEGERRWLSPFAAGRSFPDSRKQIEAVLTKELESLLPDGELVVQTFQDQKRSRTGWADVLFAAKQPRELGPEQRAALEPLLGILDPELSSRPTGPESVQP